MNTDDDQDPVPHDESDDPEFIKAALLLQKIWDLNPDSRPVPKRDSSEPLPAHEPAEQSTTQKENLAMLPAEERHQRKCVVCHHPDREEIEEEFIHWRDVYYLAKQYDIRDCRSIDRHARALGLVERRRENRRYMLDRILENGPGKVTPHAVIQAIRAYSCLTDDNRWIDPPTRVEYAITTNRPQTPPPNLEPARSELRDANVRRVTRDSESAATDSEPVPTSSGPTHSEPITIVGSATPPPNLPTWNGRFL
jgi:hypothetical protein